MDEQVQEALRTFTSLISREQHGSLDTEADQQRLYDAFATLVNDVVEHPTKPDEDKKSTKKQPELKL